MARQPGRFTDSELSAVFSFFQQVKARFASDPTVYADFLRIFQRFSRGETTDRREVTADVYELLRGHPDLVQRLDAFLPAPVPAPREDPAPTPTALPTVGINALKV